MENTSQPRNRSNLSDYVYNSLCRDISDGFFLAGDKLGIESLAQMKNVSHMPVREALQRMSADGLVDARHNRGFFVKRVDWKDAADMWDIRIALEELAMRGLMARGLPPALVRDLRANCEEYRVNQVMRKLYRIDLEFHDALIRESGNAQLYDIMNKRLILLNTFYLTSEIVLVPSPADIERSYREHLGLLDAMERGDADAAVRLLRAHLEYAREDLRQRTLTRQSPSAPTPRAALKKEKQHETA